MKQCSYGNFTDHCLYFLFAFCIPLQIQCWLLSPDQYGWEVIHWYKNLFYSSLMHALIGHGFRRIDSTYFYLNLFLYAPTQTVCKMNNVIAKKPLHKLCSLHKTWQGQILLMIFGIKRKPVIDPIIHRLLPYLQ